MPELSFKKIARVNIVSIIECCMSLVPELRSSRNNVKNYRLILACFWVSWTVDIGCMLVWILTHKPPWVASQYASFMHQPSQGQCCKIVVNKLQRKVESRQVLNHPSTLLFETRLLLDLEWIGLEGWNPSSTCAFPKFCKCELLWIHAAGPSYKFLLSASP